MQLEDWKDFNVAAAGAAAALAGLIIVALSVNIREALKAPTIPARASAAVSTLMVALVASLAALIPWQPDWWLGIEILLPAALGWYLQVQAARLILRTPESQARLPKVVLGFLPLAAFTVGGVALIAAAEWGYAFVAAGVLLALVSSVLLAWVVLVEILR